MIKTTNKIDFFFFNPNQFWSVWWNLPNALLLIIIIIIFVAKMDAAFLNLI